MHLRIRTLAPLLCLFAAAALPAAAATKPSQHAAAPEVRFETTLGNFTVRLNPQRAPKTVANFLAYVRSGFYDGTIFHRVVPGFVIQGGGYTANYKQKQTRAPIPDEADNGLSNVRGTIAMARESQPNTATSQFYINLADNTALDYQGPGQPGYAVFGRVISGMATIDKIAKVPTGPVGPFMRNAPQAPVIINKAVVVKP